MLNPFPEFLNYSTIAPLLLRLVVGFIFIDLGLLKFKEEKKNWINSFETLRINPADLFVPVYGLLQIIGGIFLITGFFTQIASLFFIFSTGSELYIEWKFKEILKRDMVFYLLIFVISISLLLTGAGSFAFDLPL